MSTTLRRRLHHGDIDGRRNERYDDSGLDEPLLELYDRQIEPKGMFAGDVWNVDRTLDQIHIHWTFLFTTVIAQWAQLLANIVVGSRSFIERFLPAASVPAGTNLRLPYLSASYMEFNDVMKSTRNQLERELVLKDIRSVKDLPAYNLLSG